MNDNCKNLSIRKHFKQSLRKIHNADHCMSLVVGFSFKFQILSNGFPTTNNMSSGKSEVRLQHSLRYIPMNHHFLESKYIAKSCLQCLIRFTLTEIRNHVLSALYHGTKPSKGFFTVEETLVLAIECFKHYIELVYFIRVHSPPPLIVITNLLIKNNNPAYYK